LPLADFLAHPYPKAEPLLGEPGAIYLAVGTLFLVYGADGSAKSTWTVDGIAHLAAGRDWLGISVPRPVRFLVIENEGPPSLFQEKLAEKAATWDEPATWQENVFVFAGPWGEFSFANSDARDALNACCEENAIDVVTANPTLGLGVAGSGRPEETQQFVDWLVECGLKSSRAFWLLHHENKAGQISGDWGRHPDTKVQLQQDGNRPCTKLVWEKTRWATLPTETSAKSCLLEWITETKGYKVIPLEPTAVTEDTLDARLAEYLAEHPMSSTTTVVAEVKGEDRCLRMLLKSDKYDAIPAPKGGQLWFLAATPASRSDDGTPG
jgi:AAA domain-containing protein